MARGSIIPWRRERGLVPWRREEGLFEGLQREIEALHRDIDRVFEDFSGFRGLRSTFESPWTRGEVMPQLDMTEDDEAFHISIELPGMDEKDVDVTLSDHRLTIKGEKKEEKESREKDVHRRERSYGYFRRTVELPSEVDPNQISATFRKGVLTVDLPKTKEAKEQSKRIEVKAA